MSKAFPSIPPPGPGKGWNARNPEHPRYVSPGRVKAIRWMGRYSRQERGISNRGDSVGKMIETRGKNGGPVFYRVEQVSAVAYPRRWLHDHWKRENKGTRMVRCTRQGEPLPRMRKAMPGVSGKSFLRHFRKELRDEKKARDAAA